MTDRELLELAAKAAEIKVLRGNLPHQADMLFFDEGGEFSPEWNPLADDADALRLAVRLGMLAPFELLMHAGGAEAHYIDVNKSQLVSGIDHYAATRRAIVRAAAAIGESKEAK